MARLRPAAFLDRDGTLNERPPPHDYLRSPDQFVWLPGAVEGAARLAAAGYTLVVASNQRGVARGLVNEETLEGIEALIQKGLEAHGRRIEGFRYCVHELSEHCRCRKPAPGLLLDLAADLELDLERSWMIGDSASDVRAGQAAGCRCALIGRDSEGVEPDLVVASLAEGAERIPPP